MKPASVWRHGGPNGRTQADAERFAEGEKGFVLACAGSRSTHALFGTLAASDGAREGSPPSRGARPSGPVAGSLPQQAGTAADVQPMFPKRPAIAQLLLPANGTTATLMALTCTPLYIPTDRMSTRLTTACRQRLSLFSGIGGIGGSGGSETLVRLSAFSCGCRRGNDRRFTCAFLNAFGLTA